MAAHIMRRGFFLIQQDEHTLFFFRYHADLCSLPVMRYDRNAPLRIIYLNSIIKLDFNM